MNGLVLLLVYAAAGLMLGIVGFLALPVVAGEHSKGHKIGYAYVLLAFATVRRPLIRLDESLDLSLSKATTDSDWNAEKPNGDDDTAYEDPGMWHRIWSYPLAFADDVHGLLFDIRTAAVGMRQQEARERGDYTIKDGRDRFYRGFFEFDSRELVDLGQVRAAVSGGADSGQPKRKEENYKESQAKRGEESSSLKLLYPVVGLLVSFLGVWAIITQLGGGGGGSGGSSTIDVGILLALFGLSSLRDTLSEMRAWLSNHPRTTYALAGFTGILLAGSALAVSVVVLGLIKTVVLGIGFLLGFAFVPGVAWTLGPILGGFGIFLAQSILMLGFWAYDRPVFDQVDENRYELREARHHDLDDHEDGQWFRLAKSWVGFTFNPEACFGDAVTSTSTIESAGAALQVDGGTPSAVSGIPSGYTVSYAYPRANGDWDAYVPKRPRESKTYVLMHRAAGVLKGVATGRVGERAHRHAKKVYGGGNWQDNDRLILLATCALSALGAGMATILFL